MPKKTPEQKKIQKRIDAQKSDRTRLERAKKKLNQHIIKHPTLSSYKNSLRAFSGKSNEAIRYRDQIRDLNPQFSKYKKPSNVTSAPPDFSSERSFPEPLYWPATEYVRNQPQLFSRNLM